MAGNYLPGEVVIVETGGDTGILPGFGVVVEGNFATSSLELSGYTVFGLGHVNFGVSPGADLVLSGYTLTAHTGAVASLALSGYTVTAAATAPNAASASLRLSGYTLTGAATVNNLASASLTLSGYTVNASSGASASLELSGYTLTAAAFAGNHASSALELSGYTVTGAATVNNHATASLVLSGYGPISTASAALTLSGYTVTASVTQDIEVEYEGYSATRMATKDGEAWAVTHYTNYPFRQFIRFRNHVYGVSSDGLYLMEGDDDNGTPILSEVNFCPTDFASQNYSGHTMKRPRSMYLYGQLGGDVEVSCIVDEDEENAYTYRPVNTGKAAHRVIFGRGVKGQWLGFKFANTAGQDFALTAIDPDVDVLKRTIWE